MSAVWREKAPRILLGLAYLPGALNFFSTLFFGKGFLPMAPIPTEPLSIGGQFLMALGQFTPLMVIIKIVTLSSALLLLSNRAPALAVTMLTPINVGLVLVHWKLVPPLAGWSALTVTDAVWTLICVVCQLLLLRAYAENYRGLFNRFVYG